MELVGKLTPKALGWDRNNIGTEVAKVPAAGGQVLLGRIAGIVSGLRESVNGDTGDIMTGLKGNFRGISSNTELKPVTSGVCYLPGGIQDMIEGALASAQDETNGGSKKATVNFAIDLYAIPATNKAGYSFKAENLVEASATDPLAALLASAKNVKALAAPIEAKEETKAEAKAK